MRNKIKILQAPCSLAFRKKCLSFCRDKFVVCTSRNLPNGCGLRGRAGRCPVSGPYREILKKINYILLFTGCQSDFIYQAKTITFYCGGIRATKVFCLYSISMNYNFNFFSF